MAVYTEEFAITFLEDLLSFYISNCLLEQLCYCIVRTRAVNIMQFSRAISLVCIAAYSPVLSAVLAEDVTVTETVIETVTVSEPWEVS